MAGAMTLADREGPMVPIGEFARKVSRFVSEAAASEPITVTRNGEPIAVLVSFERYKGLSELEERAEDLYWAVVAIREYLDWIKEGRPLVPLAEVVARTRERGNS